MIGKALDSGRIGKTRWDDISVSATATRVGANLKPDFDFVNCGLLFPQNDNSEKVYITMQMSHKKKLGTAIRLHLHYVQTGAIAPTFACIYRFYNNGGQVIAFGAQVTTADVGGTKTAIPYTSGSMLQIGAFPNIPAPAGEELSANIDVILYRIDNDMVGDVLVKYIDAHYEIDSDGSMEQFEK